MLNKTIQALEGITSWRDFERLCATLLLVEYPSLNPLGGTRDRGRDATARLHVANDQDRLVVFGFSYQETWNDKLTAELRKVRRNNQNPSRYVFVSNRPIGDNDRVHYETWVRDRYGWELDLYDQEWLRARLELPEHGQLRQQYLHLGPETIPAFLTIDEFSARQARNALSALDLSFSGRQRELSAMTAWLAGDAPVMVLHSGGGLGKTKLCLEFAKEIVANDPHEVRFVRTEAEQFESHLSELAANTQHLIILDDAHRFDHLRRLTELISNPDYARVKLLLNTRTVFKEHVSAFAAGRYRMEELQLSALDRAAIDNLIVNPPFNIADERISASIVTLAEGSPLLAQAAARLAVRGMPLGGLSSDDILQRYFDEIVEQVLATRAASAREYIAVLAAIGGLDLNLPELRESIRAAINLDNAGEEQIVMQLTQAGVLFRGYRLLRVVPDTLADYLLFAWFFAPESRRFDFKSFILEPFFKWRSAEIMRSLAEAEFRGESPEAGSLLSEILNDFAEMVGEASIPMRLGILHSIKQLGYLRPDESLNIVAEILEHESLTPAIVEDRFWGRSTLEHRHVLSEVVDVLDSTKFRSVRESVSHLLQIANYAPERPEYRHAREAARKSLDDLFDFKPGRGWNVYTEGIEAVRQWCGAQPERELMSAQLVSKLLDVGLDDVRMSPTDTRSILISQGMLGVTPELRTIRTMALDSIRGWFQDTNDPSTRKAIIEAHDKFAVYHPGRPDPNLQALIDQDVATSVAFFNEAVETTRLGERFLIWAWAKGIEQHAAYTGEDIGELLRMIERDQRHELYLYLAEHPAQHNPGHDWHDAERKQQEVIQRLIEDTNDLSYAELVPGLEEVAADGIAFNASGLYGLGSFIERLTKEKPDLGERLLRQAVEQHMSLRHFAASGLSGLRAASSGRAIELATEWLGTDDTVLHQGIGRSYRWYQGDVTAEDLALLERLADEHNNAQVLAEVVHALPVFQTKWPERVMVLVKRIAESADDATLIDVASIIGFHGSDPDGRFHLLHVEAGDLKQIIWNFVRMSQLDRPGAYDVDQALHRLGTSDPIALLQFIRCRLEQAATIKIDDPDYDALPYQFHFALDGLNKSPTYPALIRELREWMLDADGKLNTLTLEGARQLRQLCANEIDDELQSALDEWCDPPVEHQRAVALVLREFSDSDRFHALAKRLLGATGDSIVQAHIGDATFTLRMTWGSPIPVYQHRMAAFEGWTTDPSLPARARTFAKRMIAGLQKRIEHEVLREAEGE